MKKILLPTLFLVFWNMASAQAPVITQDIHNISACTTNGDAWLFIGANNATTFTWQVSTDGGSTWSNVITGGVYAIGSGFGGEYLYIYPPNDMSMNHYQYQCVVSNASGSVTSSVAILFMSSTVPGTPAFKNPPFNVCQGSTITFQATNVDPADTIWWSSTATFPTPNNVQDDSVVAINFPSTGSQTVYLSMVSNGCGIIFPHVSTPVMVSALQSTPAGTAGGGASCTSFSVFAGQATTYSDASCNPIAALTPSGSSPVSGMVQSCVTVASSVPTYNGIPYVPRYYNLEPASNAATSTATVTLYFTQADFDAYNAARGSNPALPTGPSDAADAANLTITQFHGTGTTPDTYVGTNGTIVPGASNVVWNSSASRWEVTFSITGFSGFFVSGSPIVTLPLTLIDFSGKATTAGNQLSWTTASEENTAYFEVQRGLAGSGDFTDVARIAAAGNSEQSLQYSYVDELGRMPAAYSYRLRMTDIDGKFAYSKVVTLQPILNNLAVAVSPNPFTQASSLTVFSPAAGPALLTVTDISGKKLISQALTLQKGENALAVSMLAGLSQGLYFLQVVAGTQQQTMKFVKQ